MEKREINMPASAELDNDIIGAENPDDPIHIETRIPRNMVSAEQPNLVRLHEFGSPIGYGSELVLLDPHQDPSLRQIGQIRIVLGHGGSGFAENLR